ncbi:MAG TPA: DUF1700 domain-containing protein [Rhizomicrobium sp.]|jgi:uncharacterized membrane protein
MTRALFMSRLRQGLKGLPREEIDDIVMDYEAHFSDAVQSGRSEIDVAASLGDPLALGGELRAESRLRRWEARRNPRTFVRAGLALVGLQAFNIFILLPVLAALLFCAFIIAYVLYVVASTGLGLVAALVSGTSGVVVPALVGLGMIFGVVGVGTLLALLLDSGMRWLGRYVRLNYRLLKPSDTDGE